MRSLDTVLYRRGAVLTRSEQGTLTVRGAKLTRKMQATLNALVERVGLIGAVEELARRFPPRLLANGQQRGVSIDARIYGDFISTVTVEVSAVHPKSEGIVSA